MKANRRLIYPIVSSGLAILFALALSGVILAVSGNNPFEAYGQMFEYGVGIDSLASAVNRAVPLYFSAMAVAVGFKMGLFNIGVEGQYRIAVLIAAAVGAAITLPGPLHVLVIMLTAMAVGAVWSGFAGYLKVKRGVHEVISTIMLNYVATGLGAFLLANWLRQKNPPGDLVIKTPEIPDSGRLPSLNRVLELVGLDPGRVDLYGMVILAVLAGIGFHVLVNHTRFGFELRASGASPGASRAAGIDPNRMVVLTMVISGAIAGLVGMAHLLGFFHRYTIDFPTMLGFTGIAVALLGRNHPVGMAAGALLFGWFDRATQILDLRGIPKEIVFILQGVILLSVVVAYAVVEVRTKAAESRAVTGALQTGRSPRDGEEGE